MKTKEQRPTPPNEWLTRLVTPNEKDREFVKILSLPISEPLWDECTDDFYREWQDKYNPQPESNEEAEVNE